MPVPQRGRGRPPGKATASPRVRLAARLYASGAVDSKRAAAEAVGLHPTYFSLVTSPGNDLHKPEATEIIDKVEQDIHDKTVQMSSVLDTLGREALSRMRGLMHDSKNEAIVFKASADLLDRSQETSKVQKHQVATFSVGSDDAKMLAAAMLRSAQARSRFAEAAEGDFVRIPIASTAEEAVASPQEHLNGGTHAGQQPHATALRQGDQVERGSASASSGQRAS